MSLPKLNNVPKYKTIIPSTNQEIDFRPFLVREEKILLIGLESQDPVQIATSILDTVVSCLYGEIDSNKLTSYDIEYLFLRNLLNDRSNYSITELEDPKPTKSYFKIATDKLVVNA